MGENCSLRTPLLQPGWGSANPRKIVDKKSWLRPGYEADTYKMQIIPFNAQTNGSVQERVA